MRKNTDRSFIRLSDLCNATKTINVDFDGVVVEVTFKAGFWTSKVEADYFDGEGRFAEKNNRIIAANVTGWNITDDDGKVVPITPELLESVNAYLTDAIVTAMVKAVNPNATSSQG